MTLYVAVYLIDGIETVDGNPFGSMTAATLHALTLCERYGVELVRIIPYSG